MFGMLTQFYYNNNYITIDESYGDVWREVFVYQGCMLCVYDYWNASIDYMVVRYMCGKIDLSIYREHSRFDHELMPASLYFAQIL